MKGQLSIQLGRCTCIWGPLYMHEGALCMHEGLLYMYLGATVHE
jgi:hypothetical protein